MAAIEQAIFTSVRGAAMDGYQLAATSAGLSDAEKKELGVWGPAHDSLLDPRPRARSINFHRLASGRFCISLTTALDAEYSGRGGCQVYTHSLIAEPETLLRFANNPFRVVEAALAAGQLTPHAEIPPELGQVQLPGAAAPVNGILLTRLLRRPGAAAMAHLVEVTLQQKYVSVASSIDARTVVAGLFNLLPIECRTEFSFTTGLRHSARRPYRLAVLSEEPDERRRTTAGGGAVALELDKPRDAAPPDSGWAGFIRRVLADNAIAQFGRLLRETRPTLACADLDALGDTLGASLHSLAAIN